MLATLERGGPDDAGIFTDSSANIAIGHRRLSIIDLSSTGHQPMTTPDYRFTITYNGEVYNYKEIRCQLEQKGVVFKGSSDAEVVLHAFAKWGPECVKQFIGMFAFVVWDHHKQTLHLIRDRLGVKPLYYYNKSGRFAFASELKALHAAFASELEVDQNALGEFFHYGYISAPQSIYKNVYKLEPGHFIRISSDHSMEKVRYWSVEDTANSPQITGALEEIEDELENLLIDAFKKRLVADVPVGIFLSGGIDSSLVTAILAKHTSHRLKTFTIGFHEKGFDESSWARKIAEKLGTEHTELKITSDDAREVLSFWPEIYDEPFGDISGVPTHVLSKLTREHVKVSLSADGGDELFCGYRLYHNIKKLSRYMKYMPAGLLNVFEKISGFGIQTLPDTIVSAKLSAIYEKLIKIQSFVENMKGGILSAYPFAVSYMMPDEVRVLLGSYTDNRNVSASETRDVLDSLMQWDIRHYLPEDILTKVDRATMSVGLEGREPMLDHRIAEFALRLPVEYKYRDGKQKYILKNILKRYLPEHMFDRPKQGFGVPIQTWLKGHLSDLVEKYLNPDMVRAQTQFDRDMVKRMVWEYKNRGSVFSAQRIWLLIVFMMWQEKYFGRRFS